ncbi:MAG TPA: polysaccharide deacetylase family protein [Cytophagaceae bacterium]|jgi:peptidoglycan/xylan/chitin deacetylase (PgdA/CDA1 family)|nr:polysaccharide deacetylase family protein [Cytophagaceae bacterium]
MRLLLLLRITILIFISLVSGAICPLVKLQSWQPEICITLDDIGDVEKPLYSPLTRDSMIRQSLRQRQVRAGAFFIGKYIESDRGKEILHAWDNDGHLILNHTYSHPHYDQDIAFKEFSDDVLKCDNLIKGAKNYKRIFRFPYLEEGDTQKKRDAMREFLKKNNYQNGYVSVVTTDWWIDAKLEELLAEDSEADVTQIKNLYLTNVKECAEFYRTLGEKVQSDLPMKHVILLHHNLLNALFLGDLIDMLRQNGWKVISAEEAFSDPIYQHSPNIFPSNSSLLTSISKERGVIDGVGGKTLPENMVYDKLYRKRFGLR